MGKRVQSEVRHHSSRKLYPSFISEIELISPNSGLNVVFTMQTYRTEDAEDGRVGQIHKFIP